VNGSLGPARVGYLRRVGPVDPVRLLGLRGLAGVVGAVFLTRVLTAFLFGVTPLDPAWQDVPHYEPPAPPEGDPADQHPPLGAVWATQITPNKRRR